MKKKETSKQRELRESWEAVLKKHSKPLERGAKSFGVKNQPIKVMGRVQQASEFGFLPAGFEKFNGPTSKATKVYTGEKVLGIATMHKSNAVPIFSSEEAVEVSSMRR